MLRLSNSFDVNNFRERTEMNCLPNSSSLTYDGLMNSYHYPIIRRETENQFNVEFSFAKVINPIDKKEELFLSYLLKSKYDGIGNRNKPIDVVVILDISGSMNSALGRSKDSCLTLAKQAILKLSQKLNSDDRLGLCTFDDSGYKIFELSNFSENSKIENLENKISKIKANGGTNLFNGLKTGYEILKSNYNEINEKRLLFLTDMNDLKENKFIKLLEEISQENIFTTIIGIGSNFNTQFTDKVSKIKGINYFSAIEEKHLNEIIVDGFEFNFFPTGFDVTVEFKSGYFKLLKCIGTGYKEIENIEDNKKWKTSEHLTNDNIFKRKVNFILLFFNRIKRRLPKPVLAEICNYLKYNKKAIAKVDTSYPSPLKEKDGNFLMKGGLMLLKLEKENYRGDDNSSPIKSGHINVKFLDDVSGGYRSMSFPFKINLSSIDEYSKDNLITFNNLAIRRGLSLYYYAKFLRRLMKIKNREYENKKNKIIKFTDDYLKKENVDGLKKSLINFINNNEEDEAIKNELLDQIDKTLSCLS